MEELIRYTRALMLLQLSALQAAAARGEVAPVKPELVLSQAGFTAREIAEMLDKTPAAVAKAISRARSGRRENATLMESTAEHGDSNV